MKTGQAQQRAAQLREQASLKEHLAINAMRLSSNTASNNIMLSGVGIVNQVDANHYTRLSGVVCWQSLFLFCFKAPLTKATTTAGLLPDQPAQQRGCDAQDASSAGRI
jgi:hypothetical protein